MLRNRPRFALAALTVLLAATCARKEAPAPPASSPPPAVPNAGNLDEIQVEYRLLEAPKSIPSGGTAAVRFEARNTGKDTWPATGPLPLRFGCHWSDPLHTGNWNSVVWDDGSRAYLPADVPPGGTVTLSLPVKADVKPNPGYKFVIAPLLEGQGGGWTTRVPLVLDIDVR